MSGHRWVARPVAAQAVGLVVLVLPTLAGFLLAGVIGRALPAPSGLGGRIAWWTIVMVVAIVGAWSTERLVRHLMPLRALLRASMAFPGRPPPRLRIAARRSSTEQLLSRLREARVDADAAQDAEAVTRMLVMVTALQAHDPRTRGHAERVRMLTDLLTAEVGLDEPDRDRIRWAALLHDIGKLDVPPEILGKPSSLTEEDWAIVRLHPERGKVIMAPLLPWLGEHGGGIGEHHERYDGTGYPAGIAGEDISLAARIIAVVDAYEVMTAARPYRARLSVVEARNELAAHAGSQFDPVMVRAFLRLSVRRLIAISGPLSAVASTAALRPPPVPALAGATAGFAVVVGGIVGVPPMTAPVEVADGPVEVAVAQEEADGPGGGTSPGAAGPLGGLLDPGDPGDPPDPPEPSDDDGAPSSTAGGSDPADTATGDTTTGDTTTGDTTTGDTTTGDTTTGDTTTGDAATGGTTTTIGGTTTGGTAPDATPPVPAPPPAAPAPPPPAPAPPPPAPAPPTPTPTPTPTPAPAPPPPAPAPPPPAPADPDPEPTPTPAEPATPTPAPDPPGPAVAEDEFTVVPDDVVLLDVLANDEPLTAPIDPDTLRIVEQPQHSDAIVTEDHLVQLITQPGYIGEDVFTYEVCDVDGACSQGLVTLTVERAAPPPGQDDPGG